MICQWDSPERASLSGLRRLFPGTIFLNHCRKRPSSFCCMHMQSSDADRE
jgi:hypothetical protein